MSSDEPVKLRSEPLEEIWWQGRQWARDGTYAIAASRLYERYHDGSPAWPQHMSGKCWGDMDDFCTAFLVALALHGKPAKAKAFRRGEVLDVCIYAVERCRRRLNASRTEPFGKVPAQ